MVLPSTHRSVEELVSGVLQQDVPGARWYLQPTPEAYVIRLIDLAERLGFGPVSRGHLTEFARTALESGHQLREAGDSSYLGLHTPEGGVFRPGDIGALAHEFAHYYGFDTKNPERRSKINTEAGATAFSIGVTGNFAENLAILHGSDSYTPQDKREGTIIAHAMAIIGLPNVLGALRSLPPEAPVHRALEQAVDTFIHDQLPSLGSLEYLTNVHHLSRPVAHWLHDRTGERRGDLALSLSKVKIDTISAYHALIAFRYVTLGIPHDEAVVLTEKDFLEDSAIANHHQLVHGASEIVGRLIEYGYQAQDLATTRDLCENILESGPATAAVYSGHIPHLLDLAGHYDLKSIKFLEFLLENPSVQEFFCRTNLAEGLSGLAKHRSDLIPLVLQKLQRFPWQHERDHNSYDFDIGYAYASTIPFFNKMEEQVARTNSSNTRKAMAEESAKLIAYATFIHSLGVDYYFAVNPCQVHSRDARYKGGPVRHGCVSMEIKESLNDVVLPLELPMDTLIDAICRNVEQHSWSQFLGMVPRLSRTTVHHRHNDYDLVGEGIPLIKERQ